MLASYYAGSVYCMVEEWLTSAMYRGHTAGDNPGRQEVTHRTVGHGAGNDDCQLSVWL